MYFFLRLHETWRIPCNRNVRQKESQSFTLGANKWGLKEKEQLCSFSVSMQAENWWWNWFNFDLLMTLVRYSISPAAGSHRKEAEVPYGAHEPQVADTCVRHINYFLNLTVTLQCFLFYLIPFSSGFNSPYASSWPCHVAVF